MSGTIDRGAESAPAAALEQEARSREAEGRPAEAAAAWEQLAAGPAGPARAAALTALARLLAGPLERPDAAPALLRRALANDPANGEALDALHEHATANGNWALHANVLRRRFDASDDASLRAEIAFEAGQLELERLHNPGGARSWFEAGAVARPERPALHEALADLARAAGDDRALLRHTEQVIDLRGSDASASRLLEAANLRIERADPNRALSHLQRASESAPDNTLVLDTLAEVLASLDRVVDLADVLERRAALAADDKGTQAVVLAELGELHSERLFDPEAALDAFERARTADPSVPGIDDTIARLRAKLEAATGIRGADVGDEIEPGDEEQALARFEREAEVCHDRARVATLAREIHRLSAMLGTPLRALPWVQRWVTGSPEEREALELLASLFEVEGQETKLASTLEALDPALDPAEQGPNRRRLGALYARLARPNDALRCFEAALASDPSDVHALEERVTVLRAQGPPQALVGALWQLAEQSEATRRPAILQELADLQEEIQDLAGAIDTLARLERDDPSEETSERLDTLLERAGHFDALEARLAERRDAYDPGNAEAVAIELRRAQLLLEPLRRVDDAASAFREILVHAPESPEAIVGLEAALRASIDASALADFLDKQSSAASDSTARERSALERAVLLEELLDRADDARAVYRELATAAENAEVREDASRRYELLLERTSEWVELRDHLERALGRGGDDEDARLHERLARVCADRIGDEAGELTHLERVVELDAGRGDVWRALADRYADEDRRDDVIRAHEGELEAGTDAARALTLHARVAELLLESGSDEDAVRARPHYERVFALDPGHHTAARFLIERYEAEDRPEAIIEVLEGRLAALDPADGEAVASRRTALRLEIAWVRADRQDDLEGAISALEVALGETGPRAPIAEPLADAYERAGYTLDLIELSRDAAAASDEPAERANWLMRLGDTYLRRDQGEQAAHAYRQALAERPDDRSLQASLREIYRQAGDHEPLGRLLEAELTHLAGPDEIPVRLELAALLAGPLDRPEDAVLHVQRVLQLSPRHTDAFERSVALCERVGRPDAALERIDQQLEQSRAPSARADLLVRRGRLLAGPLERDLEAAAAYREAIALDPTRVSLRADLAVLLETGERWPELLDCLEAQATDTPDARLRGDLLEKGALLAWDCIAPEAALPWLERLRTLRPRDPTVPARIAEVHRAAGRTEPLLRALVEEVAVTPDPERRRQLHLERAVRLEHELGAPGRALAALNAARTDAPVDTEVLQRSEQLQRVLGRHAERAETLEMLLATGGGDPNRLHRELAALYRGELGDMGRAIEHLESAFERAIEGGSGRIEILRDLAETQREAGHVERWAECAERELASLDAAPVFDDRRRELHRTLALAYAGTLARPRESLRHLRALLDAGEDALLGSESLDLLEQTCLDLLRIGDNAVELEARLTRHLARRPDGADGWLELARLREERLQATAGALEAYRRTLQLEPTSLPALRGLRRTAERLGRWQDVAQALEQELALPEMDSPAEHSALLRRLGDVYWHRLQSTTRASRSYAAALEVNGADFASLRALERLLEAMEDWRGALDLYESEAEMLGDDDPTRRREVWLIVAALADDRTDDPERARRAYVRADQLGPLDARQQRTLAELHETAGDRPAFIETFASWCDAPDSRADGADHLRLAECLEREEREEEALARIERALEVDPTHAPAWDAAARLRQANADPTGSAEALRRAAELLGDGDAASRLETAASLLAPSDPERALELLRSAAERDPGAIRVHQARAAMAATLELHAEAEQSAASALDLDRDGQLDAPARAAVARIGGDAATARDRLEAAAGFYVEALRVAPDDLEAAGAQGETLYGLGDFDAARAALVQRLEAGDDYPERAQHRTLLGSCHEATGALDEALACYEATLEDDPHHAAALEAAVRMCEALGPPEATVAALERWARSTADPTARALQLLRAAECELEAGDRVASAETHLREALGADPELAPAWIAHVRLLLDAGRLDEAIEAADRSAVHIADERDLGTLALLQGRAYEQHGARPEAAESFGVAAEADPANAEAALAQARLLRGFGEWRPAAQALRDFAARHPGGNDAALADVHEQLGRLLAGPLEEVDEAVTHYRRAVELAPDGIEARAALAELLSHRPGDWEEAIGHHRRVLLDDPADAAALRVGLRIARGRADPAAIGTGVAILRALGVASAWETEEDDDAKVTWASAEPALEDPDHEQLRRLAEVASREIGDALEAGGAPESPDANADDPEASFRAAVLRHECRLIAPALLPLPAREVGEVLTLVAALVLDPDQVHGDGRRVNALSTALRRRARRKLRKLLAGASLDALRSVDFEVWRTEVRALAAAESLREADVDLRVALVALIRESVEGTDPEPREGANLAPLVTSAPAARALLRRIVRDWLDQL